MKSAAIMRPPKVSSTGILAGDLGKRRRSKSAKFFRVIISRCDSRANKVLTCRDWCRRLFPPPGRLRHGAGEQIDAAVEARGALGRRLGAAADFLDRLDLLVRTQRHRARYAGDAADDVAHLLHRAHRRLGGAFDFRDLAGNVARRGAGALGQRLDLIGDHGEAAPILAGARRLDGRIEGEQAGLAGNAGDEADDFADPRRRSRQPRETLIGLVGLFNRITDQRMSVIGLASDLLAGGMQFLDGGRNRANGGRSGACSVLDQGDAAAQTVQHLFQIGDNRAQRGGLGFGDGVRRLRFRFHALDEVDGFALLRRPLIGSRNRTSAPRPCRQTPHPPGPT